MIGDNIRSLREAKGLTQGMLADKLNVSDKTISSWENNRTEPSVEMIHALSSALKCPVYEIIGEYDNSFDHPFPGTAKYSFKEGAFPDLEHDLDLMRPTLHPTTPQTPDYDELVKVITAVVTDPQLRRLCAYYMALTEAKRTSLIDFARFNAGDDGE